MKQVVVNLLQKALKKKGIKMKKEEIEKIIEVPPSSEMGDYAFPCFFLAEKLKKNPHKIALEIKDKISDKNFENIQVLGGYINFFVDKKKFAENIINKILKEKDRKSVV